MDALISSLSTSSTPQNLSASSNAVSTPNQLKEQAKPGAAGKKSVGVVDALIPSLTTSSTPQNLSASANAVPSLSQVKEQTKPGAAGKKSVGVVDALIPSLPTNSTPQNLSASSNIVTTLNQLKEQIKSGTAGKKSVGGVVDALIPPLPSNSTPQNLSTSSNAASTQNQVKEQTKSHPKERIPIAPPTLTRPEGIAAVALLNQVKEQAKSSQKERLPSTTPAVSASRSDGLAAVPRHENNGSFNKLEKLKSEPTNQPSKIDSVSKPRQRADTVPRLDNKDVKTLPRASGFSEAMSLVKPTETDSLYSTKSDYPADLSKNRSNNIRESIIQLCPDITVIKNDNHNSRPSKTESTKARFESTIASNLEPPKFNRADSLTSSDSKTQYDDVQCLTTTKVDSNTGKLDNLSDSSVGSLKLNKPKTSVVPSSSSLASFVDSGLRWSGRDSAYKSGESHGSENSHRKNMESYNRSESSVKEPSVPEQEDEESLLQRDLERVLEQIGQITNQVESKDHNPTQQSAQISVIGESKTKSVIKTTASANLASTMVVPNQTPPKSQFTPLPQRTITSSSGSTGSSNRSAGPATSSPSSSQIQQNQTGL